MNRWFTPVRLFILALTLAAFALWLAGLSGRSLWADEFATDRIMRQPDFAAMLAYTPLSERRPPLYYILLWWWGRAAATQEFSYRYLSLLFTTLTVPTSYAMARGVARLFRRSPDAFVIVTSLLVALSPAIALFGVMIRSYPMLLCLALLLNLAFARWMRLAADGAPDTRVERRAAVAWFAVALALIYTDYSALALIGAHTLWVFANRGLRERLWRRWLGWLALLALGFLLLVPSLTEQVERAKLDADLSRDPLGFVLRLVYPLFVFPFGETILPWHPAVLLAMPFLALALFRVVRDRRARPLVALAALIGVAPLLFNTFILTAIATDLTFLTIASRTLFSLPMFVLIVAAGIVTLPGRWRFAALAAVMLANGWAIANLFGGVEYHNPIYAVPLREIHATIRAQSKPGDLIVSDLDIVYQYYWQRDPIAGTQLLLTEDEPISEIERLITRGSPPRVWLFIFGRDRSRAGDRVPRVLDWLAPRYALREERDYAPTDPLYRALKERLIPREAYAYKLIVRLYERKP